MISNKKIYVIIVTYNGEKWISKCLESVENNNIPVNIIVIDNNSTDSTIQIIKTKFPNVELIKSKINLGFGKGNNIGLKKALKENADYVFLLNQDAWIEINTIEKLVNTQQKNQDYGILSPFHLDYKGNEIEYYFSTIMSPEHCPNLINDIYFGKKKELYEIDFIHAAAWLISKKCLETVGGFDPIFPHYSEDNDYINRAEYFKFKVGIVPESIVFHKGKHAGLYNFDYNFILHLNFIILSLKNINHKFRGLFLVYLKTSCDKITSTIIYRRFKDFRFQIKLFTKSLFLLKKILKTRKNCKEKTSYL
jgi:GT2 family glycosyltransferase